MPLLTAVHPANLCASLVVFLLVSKLDAAARWLATVRVFRVPAPLHADLPGTLGSAANIGVVRLSPPAVRALAFFGEWEAAVTALALVAANLAVGGGRAALFEGSGLAPAAVAGGLAALAAAGALAKAEADTAPQLRGQVRGAAGVAAGLLYGAAVTAALLAKGGAHAPDIGLAAGAVDASAAVAAVNPELTAAVPPPALAAVVGVAAAAAALLLPPAAARAVRAGELACRPPAWGVDMLRAGPVGRAAVSAALAAPLLTILLWLPPTAAVWGLDPPTLAAAQAASLIAQGALLAAAARPLVNGHLGAALCVWYTRKHGLVAAKQDGGGMPSPPDAAARAGEVARLASRVVLYFSGKAALQVAAPAAWLIGTGALALHGVTAAPGTPGAAAARALGLGSGGAAALVWAAATAWHLLLFRIGFLTDVPAARVGA